MDEVQIVDSFGIAKAHEAAVIDSQIATAKQYPRDIRKVIEDSVAIATMDKETADSCEYGLPRGGKTLKGASVHLAKIIASNYGNIRTDVKVVSIEATEIVAQARCFDLEKNYGASVEVRRKITTKAGARFNEDMINTTGRAACSVALRNVILDVVPKAVWNKVYQEAVKTSLGDLSDEAKMIAAKKKAIQYFEDTYGATVEDLLTALGLRSEKQIKASEVAKLRGIINSLKDGEITPDELFGWEKEDPNAKKKEMKANGDTKPDMP